MDMLKRKRIKRIYNSTIAVLLVIAIVLSSVPQAAQAAVEKTSKKVYNQAQLTDALANKNIETITIQTSLALKFTVPSKAYKTKTLVINSPKASITNSGTFKKLIVTDAKSLAENAKGNSITINDKQVAIKVAKGAEVKTLTLNGKNANYNIATNGKINQIVLSKKAEVVLTGDYSEKIAVQIKTAAKASYIISSVPVVITTATDGIILLKKGAEGSIVTSTDKDATLKVENKTTKSVKITTPAGKETVAAGKTMTSQNEPTKVPENSEPTKVPENSEPTKAPEKTENTPTITPSGSSNTTYYTVTFDSNGGTSIDSLLVASEGIIATLPAPQKNNSIFLGWYTDSGHQSKFSEGTAVYSNLTLYAKYSEIEIEQQNLNDSFTLTEQNTGLAFTIISDTSMNADNVKGALELLVADGSEAVELTVTGDSGTFLVTAQSGFTEGASYSLTLNDSKLSFVDKESTIRKCSFNIAKSEVYNIELNDGIIYIPMSTVSDMVKNGAQIEELSLPVVNMTESGSSDGSASGTFTYMGSNNLKIGDVLCIYSGDKPKAPNGDDGDAEFMDDNIAYVKVTAITGSTGSQRVSYSNADSEEVLFVPDVLPISVGEGNILTNYTAATENVSGSLTAVKSDLNFVAYTDMGLTGETTIDAGDFLALYTGTFNSSGGSVVYGEVTSVTENNGNETVSFAATTAEKMQEVLDYYSKNEVDGDALLEDIDVNAVEEEIEQQVQESDFAEDASEYLTALALETDGFQEIAGEDYDLEDLSVKLADGTDADLNVIKSMSTSSNVLIKNLKINADISKNLQKISGKGIRCAVTVSFDVQVKAAGDNNAIIISLSATFVEELKVNVDASGKAIWKWKWIFPYIADYQMNANIDVYDYTGISFQAKVATKGDTNTIDISTEMQKILAYTDPGQISTGVQKLFDIYGDMMENQTDWIDIFTQNISTNDQHLLLGIINIKTTVDFVVSANINVALGCNFEYKSGTRYCFWAKVKAKDAGSNTIDLMDEQYTFQFYVMGSLGLRAGIRLEFAVGLFSVDLASIGLTAEAGVYARLYGYFFYQLDSINNLKTSKMSGALYLDFGIYMKIAFKAQALKSTFQYNPTLYEHEWPLLSVGSKYNVYDFAYDKSTNIIKLKDTVKTYTLPDSTYNMTYLDLKEGDISTKTYKVNDFNTTFSNSNFSLENNTVKVNVPKGTHKLECDMTVSWKSSSLAFSSVPMTRTFHLVWDDLNDNGYTITYDSKGGNAVSSVTKLYGATVTEPTVPQKTGYTFGGWYSNVNLTTKYAFGTMPAENVVLYAKWTPNTNTSYKVEHYQQNVGNDNYTLYENEITTGTTGTSAMATAKTYSGFTFNSNAIGTVSSSIIAPDGSLVLKQYYSRNSYTLTYMPQNGGNDIVKTVKYGAVISAPTVVKTGYTFKSWDNAVVGTMSATNTTYTAQWTPNNYTIEFNANGGSTVNKITQAYGTTVNSPTKPTKLGYTFADWYSDSSLTKPYTFITMSAENITLYAKWNLKTNTAYKVQHYQQNVADDNYTLYATEELTGTTGNTATATSKTYAGFNYFSNANETFSSGIIAADGSLVLKLYYARNSYTVTFKPDNGGNDIVQTDKYGAIVSTPTVVKTWYTFDGWDKTVDTTIPAVNTTYIAQWTPNKYTIEFNSDGGNAVSKITLAYGATVNTPTAPTKAGYIFADWYSDSDLTKPYTFTTMPAENITLYAKWNLNANMKYTVEHYQQNVSGEDYTEIESEEITGTFNTTVTATAKTYTGFTYNSGASGEVKTGTLEEDGNLTLKLYYNRNSYTLTFKPENESEDIVTTMRYGAAISAPSVEKTDHTFIGWNQTVAGTMPAANTTYTAQWSINNYSIEFISNGGNAIDKITQVYGTNVIAPTTPTKAGNIFEGWYSDIDLTIPYIFDTMPAENIMLYANWNLNTNMKYTVEHYQQNVSGQDYTEIESEEITGTFNTTVTATAKTYTGFTYNSGASGEVKTGTLEEDGSLTLKLYYNRDNYTLTFKPENDSEDIVTTIRYGAAISAPSVEKTDHTFIGWNQTVAATMPAANTTYTAQWSINNYSIEFISNGGNAIDKITQVYGTNVIAPTTPTKAGNIFEGWYSDIDLTIPYIFDTMPAENITLYAGWTVQDVSGRLEAEYGVFYGSALIENTDEASNGMNIGFIQTIDSGVRFVDLQACTSIIFAYANISISTASIYVNGTLVGTILLPNTAGYQIYQVIKITGLNLVDGNTLAFQYASGGAYNIDYIAYTASGTVPTEIALIPVQ